LDPYWLPRTTRNLGGGRRVRLSARVRLLDRRTSLGIAVGAALHPRTSTERSLTPGNDFPADKGPNMFMDLLLTVFLSGVLAHSSSSTAPADPLDSFVSGFQKAESPDHLARMYHTLSRRTTDEELRRIMSSTDPGVALAAYWERLRRTVMKV